MSLELRRRVLKKRKIPSHVKEVRTAWVMMAPALIVLGLMQGYPIIRTFWLSFHEMNLKRPQSGFPLVGLANYAKVLTDGRAGPASKAPGGHAPSPPERL